MKTKTRKARKQERRPAWKGLLRFSLVSIPVRAFPARSKNASHIDLDWLHRDCGERIHYQKVCPVHGEVTKDEIVSAYKYNKQRYIEIEPEELDQLRTKRDEAINIETFIPADEFDPIYYTDRTYYLLPEDAEAARAYHVFHRAMTERGRHGLAQVVLFRREQMVLIRPYDDLLAMTVLSYQREYQNAGEVAAQLPNSKATGAEMRLALQLIDDSTAKHFDYREYEDGYAEKLHKLIESKAHGHRIKPPEEEEEPGSLNFTDALRKSIARARSAVRRAHARRKVS